MSREIPILFNTDMVQAILEGRKTVTRRVMRPANPFRNKEGFCQGMGLWITSYSKNDEPSYIKDYSVSSCWMSKKYYIEKYGTYHPDDILYVRETWYKDTGRYIYRADYVENEKFYQDGKEILIKWHPSIHMPKAAARIWLKVTDVRVERLQDITEEQAKAEGAVRCYEEIRPDEDTPVIYQSEDGGGYYTLGFKTIWNSLTKKPDIEKYGWDADPYVWVIEFERCEKPERRSHEINNKQKGV